MERRKSDQFIDKDAARRLCIELIAAFQQEKIRARKMAPEALISSVIARTDPTQVDDIVIGEDTVGIDSIALLDVVMQLTRFFGLDATGVEDYLLVEKTLGAWSNLVAVHFEKVGRDAKITFSTSGSTGPPKHISQPSSHLRTEIDAIAQDIFQDLLPTQQILSAVAPHHIYGFLWTVLLPSRLDAPCKDLHNAAPSGIARIAKPGSVIIATPFLWEEYARFGLDLPNDVTGISSGGPTSHNTWQAARSLGLERLIEVYGSTETGGIGWRSEEGASLSLLGHLQRYGDQIWRTADQSPCPVQDTMTWQSDRCFNVHGRPDRVVQVAGTNVSLDVVEDTLRDSGLADFVAVRPNGQRLKAFIVPKEHATDGLETELRKHLLRLPAVARPEHFTYGRDLPRNAMGKLQDW